MNEKQVEREINALEKIIVMLKSEQTLGIVLSKFGIKEDSEPFEGNKKSDKYYILGFGYRF